MKYIRCVNPVTEEINYLRYFDGQKVIFTDVKQSAIAFGNLVAALAMLNLIKLQGKEVPLGLEVSS